MMKIAMLAALTGHILCGVSDCLLSYSKSGRLNLKEITDSDKMSEMFEDMPQSFPLVSMLLGTAAITMFGFGYFALSDWMSFFSKTAFNTMFISSVIFLIFSLVMLMICTIWMASNHRFETDKQQRWKNVIIELIYGILQALVMILDICFGIGFIVTIIFIVVAIVYVLYVNPKFMSRKLAR